VARYLKSLLLYLVAVVVSTAAAPILPLFAVMCYGHSNNRTRLLFEPRLPTWLAWFDNPDNSLWGDDGWQREHCPRFFGCYRGMVRWLWRNKAGGFVWNVLGAKVAGSITWEGTPGIDSSPYKAGKLTCRSGDYWQWKWVSPPIGRRCLVLNFGWLLDAFIDNPFYAPAARFLFQIQFSEIKE